MDKGGIVQMAKLVAFYSRADENYFGGSMKYIQIGNTEKAAKMIADMTGAELFKIVVRPEYDELSHGADRREIEGLAKRG